MRNMFLSTVSLLLMPAVSFAAPEFPTHAHTPIELKPISQIDEAYKTASICFLGNGGCDENGLGNDNDYTVDSANQCLNEGYKKLNCNSVQEIDHICPYNSEYGLNCICLSSLISCSSNQVGIGVSCDGKYSKCNCPSGVSIPSYGCQEYYSVPCSHVCKTAYNNNCHNRIDNNSEIYGCLKYYNDCDAKCETPYKDNCRNRTDIYAPFGCKQYWSDCSTKCQIAVEKTICSIGSIYYADGTCTSPENFNRSQTALGIVVYVTSGGEHGQVLSLNCSNRSGPTDGSGSCGVEGFGAINTDVPTLTNHTSFLTAAKDYDSCGNTDKLLKYSDSTTVKAARRYCPTNATCGKWCLPAAGVLANIYENKTAFQASLNVMMSSPGNFWASNMWSSTEADQNNAWFSMTYGTYLGLSKEIKSAGICVRPVLEF